MSDSVLAMTGIAETHIATPRNRAKTPRGVWPGMRVRGSRLPARMPSPSGRSRPARLTPTALPPRRRIAPISRWAPVTPTSSSTPSWPTASSRFICVGTGGSSQCANPGASCPSRDGPSSTPVSSSPTIAGMPSRSATRPRQRATTSSVASCRSRTSSWCAASGAGGAANTVMCGSFRTKLGSSGGRRRDQRRPPGIGGVFRSSRADRRRLVLVFLDMSVEGAAPDRLERREGVPLGLLEHDLVQLVVLAPEVAGEQAYHPFVQGPLTAPLVPADRGHVLPDVVPVLVVRVDDAGVPVVAGLVEPRVPVLQLLGTLRLVDHLVDRLGRGDPGGHRQEHPAGEDRVEEAGRVAGHEPAGPGDGVGVVAVVGLDVYVADRVGAGQPPVDPADPLDVLLEQRLRLAAAQQVPGHHRADADGVGPDRDGPDPAVLVPTDLDVPGLARVVLLVDALEVPEHRDHPHPVDVLAQAERLGHRAGPGSPAA